MKLSDYIAGFLASRSIRHAFVMSGGASLHLIHSVAKTPGIDFVCAQHEQACAMAADAYARVAGVPGVAMATSGPGATNLITGICCAYYDSIPMICITGQVATFRMSGDTGVRQLGFQETNIVDVCRSITKYVVQIADPMDIRYELEKAYWMATSGRPGPVLVDVPDNLQRSEVEVEKLRGFEPPPSGTSDVPAAEIERVAELLKGSERPILVLGTGVRAAGAIAESLRLAESCGLPVLPTWGALDFLPSDHPLMVGTFGTHGSRNGNYAVQNADLVLSIGSRLDTHCVGSPFSSFARGARKVMVDIDPAEIAKFERHQMVIDVKLPFDAGAVLRGLLDKVEPKALPDWAPWRARIDAWKRAYPTGGRRTPREGSVDPYGFMRSLAAAARADDIVVSDTGCGLAWACQAFAFKAGQRFFHAFNNTPMGYGLAGAIGATIASGRRVLCLTGDGGLMINIQELATVARHALPIKVVLFNNHGHGMIQQTQDQWLGSEYLASSVEGGLAFPDFLKVAESYGIPSRHIGANDQVEAVLAEALASDGPMLIELEVAAAERVIPQVKFGRPIEDQEPLLPREEFLANMIVEPMPASLTID
ncbi:acetolactate synthase, large subunit [Tistlia consotensis]|uniref:Acetolactate synthase, large subunit n=1 Tax=Tistlia consotensis USBA 355 TaxID=560819 RepID=A0A1Y6BB83_9PROT|nr:thiamine pyrophosphate-binding protein [Tistlia consotensis]SME98812.1 acetolactate synthase, large subunit [Tistlia consotensis USBA 355]SNR58229.1 acetolactate synthase, large subunit [Tistlia consotensis]